MLLLAFWSLEWEPVLADSIIHIGEFNPVFEATSVSGFLWCLLFLDAFILCMLKSHCYIIMQLTQCRYLRLFC